MRFLLDAQLPPKFCRWFEARGHETAHVYDLGIGGASDVELADRSEAEGLILVSKDEDFLTLRLPDRFTLIWLRCGNTTNRALAAWMDERWERVVTLLDGGERLIEMR